MSIVARKIPCHCPTCGNTLTYREMDEFLAWCEGRGCDPIEFAFRGTPPGIRCHECVERRLAEGMEDDEPAIKRLVGKLHNLYRYGVAELPEGKPVRWH